MLKLLKRLRKPLKNKKGFTFVEAIAVVAMMGVLAVVIGGLVGSGTTAYMRQHEAANAKDLATLIEKEIDRYMLTSKIIYLQNGALPTASIYKEDMSPYTEDEVIEEGTLKYQYSASNVPFSEVGDNNVNVNKYGAFYVEDGKLKYRKKGSTSAAESFFSTEERENKAMYGDFTIALRVLAEQNSVTVCVDVYKEGTIKYTSPGRIIRFHENIMSNVVIKSYKNVLQSTDVVADYLTVSTGAPLVQASLGDPENGEPAQEGVKSVQYVNVLSSTQTYTHIYFY